MSLGVLGGDLGGRKKWPSGAPGQSAKIGQAIGPISQEIAAGAPLFELDLLAEIALLANIALEYSRLDVDVLDLDALR